VERPSEHVELPAFIAVKIPQRSFFLVQGFESLPEFSMTPFGENAVPDPLHDARHDGHRSCGHGRDNLEIEIQFSRFDDRGRPACGDALEKAEAAEKVIQAEHDDE
jgi:hypothetical protein